MAQAALRHRIGWQFRPAGQRDLLGQQRASLRVQVAHQGVEGLDRQVVEQLAGEQRSFSRTHRQLAASVGELPGQAQDRVERHAGHGDALERKVTLEQGT